MFPRAWRELALQSLAEPFDLVIVGGGITGCGILLDAAQRGLRCLLLEKDDIASGTSSRSSKLVHGGFRYLKNLQFGVTLASCRERDLQLRRFPHLVEPLEFVFAIGREDPTPGWQVDLGLSIYDAMAAGKAPRHRRLDDAELAKSLPDLDPGRLDRALGYLDARVDDARLTWAVAATAWQAGGVLWTRAEPEEARRDAEGRLRGVVLRDRLTGKTHEVATRLLVNAAGVWVDQVRAKLGISPPRLRPSRGSHLVFARERLPMEQALAFFSPEDRRPIFVIPHPEGTLVGTTDLFHEGPLDDPRPSVDEIAYLLRAARHALPRRPLDAGDIVGAFAGIRPVIDDGSDNPSKASREEGLWLERGVLSIAGGKLTTWREMAEHVVDRAIKVLGRRGLLPCATRVARLAGFSSLPVESFLRRRCEPDVAFGMARRLGGAALDALAEADDEALRPLVDGADLCAAEARWHLRHGAVAGLGDLLLRRARFGLWQPALARELARELEPLCRRELGPAGADLDLFEAELAGWSFGAETRREVEMRIGEGAA